MHSFHDIHVQRQVVADRRAALEHTARNIRARRSHRRDVRARRAR